MPKSLIMTSGFLADNKKVFGQTWVFCAGIDKKQPYLNFCNWNKYFAIFQPQPLEPQNPWLRHVTSTISDYDTWLRSFVTLTRHFDNSSQRQKSVSFWVFCRMDGLSKWRIEVTDGRSDWWLKSHVEVKDFGSWEGVALVSKWRLPATGGLWNSNSSLSFFKQSRT